MITLRQFNAVMEVVATHMAVKAHTAAAERRKCDCLSGAAFALTPEAKDVIAVLAHQHSSGANWPCDGMQQPGAKQHGRFYDLMISRGVDPAVAARGAKMYNTRHGPMVRLCLADVMTKRPISPNDPIQDYFANEIIGDLPDRLCAKHRDYCLEHSNLTAFERDYDSMHWLTNTQTKKTLTMLGCTSQQISTANLIEGLRDKLVICIAPELAELVWLQHGNDAQVIKLLVAVKKAAGLEWCHIVPWRQFGPTACGMFLASSLDNLFLGSIVLNRLEGDRLPSPTVAFNSQLPGQLLKAVASTVAWIRWLTEHGGVSTAAKQRLESSLQLAVIWLPGLTTCQEALGVAAGNMLSMKVDTGHTNHMRTPVWLNLYTTHAPAEEYQLMQEVNMAIRAAAQQVSLQEFWAEHTSEVAHCILRLGMGPCKPLNLTLKQIVHVLAVARPDWALALQSATAEELRCMTVNYARSRFPKPTN